MSGQVLIRIKDTLRGPRAWMLFGSLLTRAAGFITSFVLSRFVGAEALGVYSSVVNTASSVVSPFSGVMANNATVMASAAFHNGNRTYVHAGRANLLLGLALSTVSLIAFAGLGVIALREGFDRAGLWVILAGASVIVGQVCAAVLQGFFHGAGRFVAVSRVYAIVSATTVIGLWPALWLGGLRGALVLLVFFSIAPAVLLAPRVIRAGAEVVGPIPREIWLEVWSRLVACFPSVAATSVNAGVNWFCAIYLVQHSHGLTGVAVVSVALQWMTLVLMPATSWGGVTLKSLAEARNSDDPGAVSSVVKELVKKNVLATLVLGGALAASSILIANAYGLAGSGLVGLLIINAVGATVASINNVYERLLLCLNRQRAWFVFSTTGYFVQLAVTYALIEKGLFYFSVGVLCASLTLCALCWRETRLWIGAELA